MVTIAAIASGDPNFSILVSALTFVDAETGSNLVETLSDSETDFTVFAPTNPAFGKLAADLGFDGDVTDTDAVTDFLVGAVPVETLSEVLLYHVSLGAQTAADIAASPTIDTLNGETIAPDLPTLVDNEPDLIDPSVKIPDIAADNGIVHAIDRVLLPIDLPGNDAPTLAGIVAASGGTFDTDNGDFDILFTAVQTAGLGDALDDPSADLTVFAPDDSAFITLAQTLGFEGSGEAGAWHFLVDALTELGDGDPIAPLTDILTYHVLPESLQESQILSLPSLTTLQGGELGVDGSRLVDADPGVTNPTRTVTDIQAANGVAHVIDGVLLPDALIGATDLEIGLYDTHTDSLIAQLEGDDRIEASTLEGRNVTIAAFVPEDSVFFGKVDSVHLDFDKGNITRIENVEPYALFGDVNGNFFQGSELSAGQKTIELELYSKNNLGGDLVGKVSLDFSVV